jgi:hypothetical protein
MHRSVFPHHLAQTILSCIPIGRCRADEARSVLLHDDYGDCILVQSIQGLQALSAADIMLLDESLIFDLVFIRCKESCERG